MVPDAVGTGEISVPHDSASVREARSRVQDDLARRGVDDDVVDVSVLVLSEMVSNALKHARPLPDGKVRVSWALEDGRLALQVTDGGGVTRPRLQQQSATSAGGRGLGVVRRLSADWGVREQGPETTVWAVIDLDARTVRRSSDRS
ncbi:ATP-binding protein [Motilibacter peucedani]|uniref:ATP-binding protein n=1 Tax=Motilibacter peucedani TaxID=598650 RepID=UPI001E59754F|nr:ATP-binding protein [Motilibacter peucedani]